MIGCEALRRGGSLEFGHLFAGFNRHGSRLFALGAVVAGLTIAIVFATMAFTGNALQEWASGKNTGDWRATLLLLSVPMMLALALSIPVYMAAWFAPALIVLNDLSVGKAMRASFVACLKNVLPLLLYGVVGLVLGVFASLPLGLGWLLLGPVVIASVFVAYRDIFMGNAGAGSGNQ